MTMGETVVLLVMRRMCRSSSGGCRHDGLREPLGRTKADGERKSTSNREKDERSFSVTGNPLSPSTNTEASTRLAGKPGKLERIPEGLGMNTHTASQCQQEEVKLTADEVGKRVGGGERGFAVVMARRSGQEISVRSVR